METYTYLIIYSDDYYTIKKQDENDYLLYDGYPIAVIKLTDEMIKDISNLESQV